MKDLKSNGRTDDMVTVEDNNQLVKQICSYICISFRMYGHWILDYDFRDLSKVMDSLRSDWEVALKLQDLKEFEPEPVSFKALESGLNELMNTDSSVDDKDILFGKILYIITSESNYNSFIFQTIVPTGLELIALFKGTDEYKDSMPDVDCSYSIFLFNTLINDINSIEDNPSGE